MQGDRWRRVVQLFGDALEREPRERGAFLDAARADPELRQEMESLLAAHEATGPLDRLAAQMDQLRQQALAVQPTLERVTEQEGAAGSGVPRLGPGDRLGRYEIRSHLGAGGMGEVYRALDSRLGRDVAVKIVGRRAQERPNALERFEQEARAASALNHPNIITVHDIGEERFFPYIVMELVEGESLRQMLAGPWPVELLLHVAVQIADGLAAAHERGIVHCDLKPENILVTRQGIAKILDFGIAQFRLIETPRDAPDSGSRAPRRGPLMGTVGYMSPEVVAGGSPDFRSDHFSFGAILYEMATGRRAFTGRTTLEVLERTVRSEPPSMAEARPDLPATLILAIARCLARSPAERYTSTRTLLDELRGVRRSLKQRPLSPPAEPLPAPRRAALPAQRTALIGRQQELAEIKRLLLEEEVRLLTLTGPGGTGKTRLALEAAKDLTAHFAGGVIFVPLAPITDPDLVAPAIAQATGCVRAGGGTALSAVIADLGRASDPTLLVLDNFEQVIDAATTVSELLAACPDVTVIVTSREVLRLYGEHDFPVHPLGRPDLQRLPPLAELAEYPAVALFVDRARAANPAFRLTPDNAPGVAEVCARLDGLPLAVELAAAHARLLSPEAMLSRLEHRLELLTGGPRDLPRRQQTLRRTLDWSHQLLAPAEQALFRRLAVFAGGFTLEAAQAVADPYEKLGAEVVAVVGALVDKSLLQTGEAIAPEPRLAMLETIREYAFEKLAGSGEEAKTRKAHAAYFLVLAEEGAAALAVSEPPPWLRRFEVEHDNFRTALDWLTREGDAEWGLRMAMGLFYFWERGEHVAEARRRLAGLLELDAARPPGPQRAKALFAAGVLAFLQGDFEMCVDLHSRSLEIYRGLGDRWGVAVALNSLGVHHTRRGEYEEARRRLEESLAVWKELGDHTSFVRSLSNLAYVAKMQGRLDEARTLYEKAAAMFDRLGDRLSGAWLLDQEGDMAREQGQLDAAQALYTRSLAVFRSLEDRWGIGSCLADLGVIARQRGDPAEAGRLYREALASFAELGHRRGIARLLETLACLAAGEGQAERGLQLAAAAATLRSCLGAPASAVDRAELERSLATMRKTLGVEAAQRAWREGTAMPLDQAVGLASQG